MSFKSIQFSFLVFIGIMLLSSDMMARNSQEEQHIEVVMRMIGHKVLLHSGDKISRVLPIERDGERYRIRFDTKFEFIPEELVSIVNKITSEADLTMNYIVAVESCDSKEVVYSYEMNQEEQTNLVPCISRTQPLACYNLLFTILESKDQDGALNTLGLISQDADGSEKKSISYFLMISLGVILIGLFYFLWFRKRRDPADPNVVQLGDYQFDKRNTELLFDQRRIELTSKEADLLILLYDAVNTTMEREEILKRIWGDEGDYVGRTLDVFISKLRKKLEEDPKVKIVNIRGVGYKLVMDV